MEAGTCLSSPVRSPRLFPCLSTATMLTPAPAGRDRRGPAGLLRTHARASTAELARQLSLARTTVQSRIDRLERLKVIVGYTVVVPDELESKMIRAHVMITVAPKLSGAVEEAFGASRRCGNCTQ